ncbi:hypothetical protein CYMTET_10874 [Cymbomonas tetramitiformis]|uniref:C3H1-type domain-containing protein n=1 Tax=Cymbomonas tetramitiformis TaxID=36881 RepID=A0AAE0GPS9_9CHLO|nr:hypothetical protein CYMTET_10874 [Cymbomonas tetramitiformis]
MAKMERSVHLQWKQYSIHITVHFGSRAHWPQSPKPGLCGSAPASAAQRAANAAGAAELGTATSESAVTMQHTQKVQKKTIELETIGTPEDVHSGIPVDGSGIEQPDALYRYPAKASLPEAPPGSQSGKTDRQNSSAFTAVSDATATVPSNPVEHAAYLTPLGTLPGDASSISSHPLLEITIAGGALKSRAPSSNSVGTVRAEASGMKIVELDMAWKPPPSLQPPVPTGAQSSPFAQAQEPAAHPPERPGTGTKASLDEIAASKQPASTAPSVLHQETPCAPPERNEAIAAAAPPTGAGSRSDASLIPPVSTIAIPVSSAAAITEYDALEYYFTSARARSNSATPIVTPAGTPRVDYLLAAAATGWNAAKTDGGGSASSAAAVPKNVAGSLAAAAAAAKEPAKETAVPPCNEAVAAIAAQIVRPLTPPSAVSSTTAASSVVRGAASAIATQLVRSSTPPSGATASSTSAARGAVTALSKGHSYSRNDSVLKPSVAARPNHWKAAPAGSKAEEEAASFMIRFDEDEHFGRSTRAPALDTGSRTATSGGSALSGSAAVPSSLAAEANLASALNKPADDKATAPGKAGASSAIKEGADGDASRVSMEKARLLLAAQESQLKALRGRQNRFSHLGPEKPAGAAAAAAMPSGKSAPSQQRSARDAPAQDKQLAAAKSAGARPSTWTPAAAHPGVSRGGQVTSGTASTPLAAAGGATTATSATPPAAAGGATTAKIAALASVVESTIPGSVAAGKGAAPVPVAAGKGAAPVPAAAGKGAAPVPVAAGKGAAPVPAAAGKGAAPVPAAAGKGAAPVPAAAGKGAAPVPVAAGKGAAPVPAAAGKGAAPVPAAAGKGAAPVPAAAGKGAARASAAGPSQVGQRTKNPVLQQAAVQPSMATAASMTVPAYPTAGAAGAKATAPPDDAPVLAGAPAAVPTLPSASGMPQTGGLHIDLTCGGARSRGHAPSRPVVPAGPGPGPPSSLSEARRAEDAARAAEEFLRELDPGPLTSGQPGAVPRVKTAPSAMQAQSVTPVVAPVEPAVAAPTSTATRTAKSAHKRSRGSPSPSEVYLAHRRDQPPPWAAMPTGTAEGGRPGISHAAVGMEGRQPASAAMPAPAAKSQAASGSRGASKRKAGLSERDGGLAAAAAPEGIAAHSGLASKKKKKKARVATALGADQQPALPAGKTSAAVPALFLLCDKKNGERDLAEGTEGAPLQLAPAAEPEPGRDAGTDALELLDRPPQPVAKAGSGEEAAQELQRCEMRMQIRKRVLDAQMREWAGEYAEVRVLRSRLEETAAVQASPASGLLSDIEAMVMMRRQRELAALAAASGAPAALVPVVAPLPPPSRCSAGTATPDADTSPEPSSPPVLPARASLLAAPPSTAVAPAPTVPPLPPASTPLSSAVMPGIATLPVATPALPAPAAQPAPTEQLVPPAPPVQAGVDPDSQAQTRKRPALAPSTIPLEDGGKKRSRFGEMPEEARRRKAERGAERVGAVRSRGGRRSRSYSSDEDDDRRGPRTRSRDRLRRNDRSRSRSRSRSRGRAGGRRRARRRERGKSRDRSDDERGRDRRDRQREKGARRDEDRDRDAVRRARQADEPSRRDQGMEEGAAGTRGGRLVDLSRISARPLGAPPADAPPATVEAAPVPGDAVHASVSEESARVHGMLGLSAPSQHVVAAPEVATNSGQEQQLSGPAGVAAEGRTTEPAPVSVPAAAAAAVPGGPATVPQSAAEEELRRKHAQQLVGLSAEAAAAVSWRQAGERAALRRRLNLGTPAKAGGAKEAVRAGGEVKISSAEAESKGVPAEGTSADAGKEAERRKEEAAERARAAEQAKAAKKAQEDAAAKEAQQAAEAKARQATEAAEEARRAAEAATKAREAAVEAARVRKAVQEAKARKAQEEAARVLKAVQEKAAEEKARKVAEAKAAQEKAVKEAELKAAKRKEAKDTARKALKESKEKEAREKAARDKEAREKEAQEKLPPGSPPPAPPGEATFPRHLQQPPPLPGKAPVTSSATPTSAPATGARRVMGAPHGLDVQRPLCPFDLRGRCSSKACSFQHLDAAGKDKEPRSSASGAEGSAPPFAEDTEVPLFSSSPWVMGEGLRAAGPQGALAEAKCSALQLGKDLLAPQQAAGRTLAGRLLALVYAGCPPGARDTGSVPGGAGAGGAGGGKVQQRYFWGSEGRGQALTKWLEEHNHDLDAWLELCIVLSVQKRAEGGHGDEEKKKVLETAMCVLARALEKNPSELPVWIPYLSLLTERFPTSEVARMCRFALQHRPNSYELWVELAGHSEGPWEHMALLEDALAALCAAADPGSPAWPHASACLLDVAIRLLLVACATEDVSVPEAHGSADAASLEGSSAEDAAPRRITLRARLEELVAGVAGEAGQAPGTSPRADWKAVMEKLTPTDRAVMWTCCVAAAEWRRLPEQAEARIGCRQALLRPTWHDKWQRPMDSPVMTALLDAAAGNAKICENRVGEQDLTREQAAVAVTILNVLKCRVGAEAALQKCREYLACGSDAELMLQAAQLSASLEPQASREAALSEVESMLKASPPTTAGGRGSCAARQRVWLALARAFLKHGVVSTASALSRTAVKEAESIAKDSDGEPSPHYFLNQAWCSVLSTPSMSFSVAAPVAKVAGPSPQEADTVRSAQMWAHLSRALRQCTKRARPAGPWGAEGSPGWGCEQQEVWIECMHLALWMECIRSASLTARNQATGSGLTLPIAHPASHATRPLHLSCDTAEGRRGRRGAGTEERLMTTLFWECAGQALPSMRPLSTTSARIWSREALFLLEEPERRDHTYLNEAFLQLMRGLSRDAERLRATERMMALAPSNLNPLLSESLLPESLEPGSSAYQARLAWQLALLGASLQDPGSSPTAAQWEEVRNAHKPCPRLLMREDRQRWAAVMLQVAADKLSSLRAQSS